MTNSIALQELADQDAARYGDPRTCPAHPEVRTSSGDGMHDAPCWKCEGEIIDAEEAEASKSHRLMFDRFERGYVIVTFTPLDGDEVRVETRDALEDLPVVEQERIIGIDAARNAWQGFKAAGFTEYHG